MMKTPQIDIVINKETNITTAGDRTFKTVYVKNGDNYFLNFGSILIMAKSDSDLLFALYTLLAPMPPELIDESIRCIGDGSYTVYGYGDCAVTILPTKATKDLSTKFGSVAEIKSPFNDSKINICCENEWRDHAAGAIYLMASVFRGSI